MTSPSPVTARTKALELLNEMVLKALGLKEALQDERKALESQDLQRVEDAVTGKNLCTEQLQVLDKKLRKHCGSCGYAAGHETMDAFIAWCDDSALVRNRWDRLMVIAAESNALNMTNGAIIRVRQQQFETSLSVLRGISPGADTYGRNGGDSGGFGHRSLAQA